MVITCPLLATYTHINSAITRMLFVKILAISACFIIIYGFLIQANTIVPAILIVLPVYYVGFLCKAMSRMAFVFCLCPWETSVATISFSNPTDLSYSTFANAAAGMIFTLIILFIYLNIISPLGTPEK